MKVFGREYRAWVKTGRLPRMQDLPPELKKFVGKGAKRWRTRKR
jgi:hypothetical protein